MAKSKEEMEGILHIADKYGKEWNLKFIERKCMVIGLCSESRNQWVLGNNVLKIVDKNVYLGMKVNKEGLRGENRERLMKRRQRGCQGD